MWESLFAAIAAIPKAFDYIEQLVAWLSQQVESYKKEQAANELAAAIAKAEADKNTSGIDQVFDPNNKS